MKPQLDPLEMLSCLKLPQASSLGSNGLSYRPTAGTVGAGRLDESSFEKIQLQHKRFCLPCH